jgi:hypothetical protein
MPTKNILISPFDLCLKSDEKRVFYNGIHSLLYIYIIRQEFHSVVLSYRFRDKLGIELTRKGNLLTLK